MLSNLTGIIMLVYIYDGSFPGLLTAIYESYYRRKPENFGTNQWQHTLLQEVVIRPMKKADKVYQAIKDKISVLRRNAYCVLAECLERRC